jgi:hypothetical protein
MKRLVVTTIYEPTDPDDIFDTLTDGGFNLSTFELELVRKGNEVEVQSSSNPAGKVSTKVRIEAK